MLITAKRALRFKIVVTSAAMVVSTTALTGTASADPGFCGVRVSGPDMIVGGSQAGYVVRNKCTATHKFKVVLNGKSSIGCWTVAGGGRRTYSSAIWTTNWVVRNC
ncbi:hypothetical protein ACIBQ6_00025 [Nonomuraea sp. NPDC049655]|uniref:hypothetical protein n=1 Tax=Nonomuraea sp. NPDC049655 TaxID=3364355 RepID=UPI00378D5D4D